MATVEIIEVWRLIGKGYVLVESSLVESQGAFLINDQGEGKERVLRIEPYATFNSPIHNLTACPGHILQQHGVSWEEQAQSNEFTLTSKSTIHAGADEMGNGVITDYTIPPGYTGPPYKKRTLYFDTMRNLFMVEMEYADGRIDKGVFDNFILHFGIEPSSEIKITWSCQYGPNHQNISFI